MAEAWSSGTSQTHVLLLPAFYLFLIGGEWEGIKNSVKSCVEVNTNNALGNRSHVLYRGS
jgi:hypothetical protein